MGRKKGNNNSVIAVAILVLVVLANLSLVSAAKKPISSKIKHVIVLMEENRSYDQMFGWWKGGNGVNGTEYNLVDTFDVNGKRIYVNKLEPYIGPCDPDHSTPATTSKVFGKYALSKNDTTNPTMCGFVEWENNRGNEKSNYCDVMSLFTPERVPVITALGTSFANMDHFYAAVPGPTWPNRIFMLSATSMGSTETGTWYKDVKGQLYPQKTIFDQLTEEGMTWKIYYNDTPWEMFIESVAHNTDHMYPLEQLYEDAQNGNLPSFAWINPRSGINITMMQGSNDQHPDHDVSLGEQLYKDIYESLRASPQWNETLFVLTYDEHGGFYDHVKTPLNVPPPDDEKSYPDNFGFDRLGIRIPTIIVSPWIPAQTVSFPPAAQKPAPNSEYTTTSIIATTRILLNMTSGPLTKRDAWSATFEQLLSLDEPRTDCPMHLPATGSPSKHFSPEAEMKMPLNGLQETIAEIHAHLGGVPFPKGIPQGKFSIWAQEQFLKHKSITDLWKQSIKEPAYDLFISRGPAFKSDWGINQSNSTKKITISLRKLDPATCLYYGKEAREGTVVGVSVCYPSFHPETNRDPGQQWIYNDGTFRPFANTSLCLSNTWVHDWKDPNLYLLPCIDTVQQHWGYSGGHTPGNGESDHIYFGDAGYIGIRKK